MKRIMTSLLLVTAVAIASPQAPGLQTFFTNFTAEWVRGNPNGATASRFFTGPTQDRLERQLTPETEAYRRERIKLARRGLAELRKFDRTKVSDAQRVSAEL